MSYGKHHRQTVCRPIHQWWRMMAEVTLRGAGNVTRVGWFCTGLPDIRVAGRCSSGRTHTKTGANHCVNLATSGQGCPRSLNRSRARRSRRTPRACRFFQWRFLRSESEPQIGMLSFHFACTSSSGLNGCVSTRWSRTLGAQNSSWA